eukprot:g1562.t1
MLLRSAFYIVEGNEDYPEDGWDTRIEVYAYNKGQQDHVVGGDKKNKCCFSRPLGHGGCHDDSSGREDDHEDADREDGSPSYMNKSARTSRTIALSPSDQSTIFGDSPDSLCRGDSDPDEKDNFASWSDARHLLTLTNSGRFFRQRSKLSFLERLAQYPDRRMNLHYAASRVWPSALALADAMTVRGVLDGVHESETRNVAVLLELGCGLGVTGMVMARSGSYDLTVLTDLPEVVGEKEDQLADNVLRNFGRGNDEDNWREWAKPGNIVAMPFDWNSDKDLEAVFERIIHKVADHTPRRRNLGLDLRIVCADCIHKPLYGEGCVDLLLKTLRKAAEVELRKDINDITTVAVEALVACEHRSPNDGVAEFCERAKTECSDLWTVSEVETPRSVGEEDGSSSCCTSSSIEIIRLTAHAEASGYQEEVRPY